MEEKRIKFGIEMLPSLKKRLKARALERDQPLWAVTQEAVERYLDPPAANTALTLPGPYAGLTDDQIWIVANFIDILRDQPQGGIFRALETVVDQAIKEHRTHHAAEKASRSGTRHSRRPTGT